MLRIDSVRSFIRGLFVREVEVREVVVDRVVEIDRVVEVEKRVAGPTTREYWVLASHRPTVVATGTVVGATEWDALRNIHAFAGERIQISNGGRYRVHGESGCGAQAFTRIDRASRHTTGARAAHRSRTRDNGGVIVGE